MSAVTIDIRSNKENAINEFLLSYYNKTQKLDKDIYRWVNVFDNPMHAIDIVITAIENKDKYNLQVFLNMDLDYFIEVTESNLNSLVKFMLFRFQYN